jgi:hypothetical protein
MHAVMQDISYVQKGEKTVNGQYRFVSHDAVTAKVREALVKHGIMAMTDVTHREQDGNRTSVVVEVTFVNIDEPADKVAVRSFGYGIDPQDKGPGKAISYAVKYAFLKAFALETGDDPERDSINHAPGNAAAKAPPTNALERIQATDPGNARKATTDAFASLPEEAQQVTREWAMEVVAHLNDGDVAAAFDFIELQDMDSEGKMALWSLLDSKARSAIKKEQERRRIAGVKKVPMEQVSASTKAMFDEMHRQQDREAKPHISEQA